MESIIKDNMIEYLNDQLCLTKHQHGSVSNRSCLTNLLETLESWTASLDNTDMIEVDTVYLNHKKCLLQKLKAYGIDGQVLAWISSFLTGSHRTVSIRGQTSEDSLIHSGVPQSSVIGPILSLAYVNDIVQVVDSQIKLFADNAKVWSQIQKTVSASRMTC